MDKIIYDFVIKFLIINFQFVEWQCDDDEPAAKVSHKSEDDFKRYYDKLKASLGGSKSTPDEAVQTVQPLSDDKGQLLKEVRILAKNVEDYKRRGWDYYFHLGCGLAKLKRMYFKMCSVCESQKPDMFQILSCKRCAKVSNGNTFFKDVQIDYDNGHINFLISVAGLVSRFRKLMETPYNSGDLKKYMPYLASQLEKDKMMWI